MSSPISACLQEEITKTFGKCGIKQVVAYPGGRNVTLLIRSDKITAVAKLYESLRISDVIQIGRAEDIVSARGVHVPRRIYQSSNLPLVVYEFVVGAHRQALTRSALELCAGAFEAQLRALRDFVPSWAPARPRVLPARALQAVGRTRNTALRDFVFWAWERLSDLAGEGSKSATHVDWRADNLIFGEENGVTVLDWEALALVPTPEALGYAAASFTHSWRSNSYAPFLVDDAYRFLEAGRLMSRLEHEGKRFHVRLALAFAGAVRVAEDEARSVAKTKVYDLADPLRADGLVW